MNITEKEFWKTAYHRNSFVPIQFFIDNAQELEGHTLYSADQLTNIVRHYNCTEICRGLVFDKINHQLLQELILPNEKRFNNIGIFLSLDHCLTIRDENDKRYAITNPYYSFPKSRIHPNTDKAEIILNKLLTTKEQCHDCKIQVFPNGIYNPEQTIGIVIPEAVIHAKLGEMVMKTFSSCVAKGENANEKWDPFWRLMIKYCNNLIY